MVGEVEIKPDAVRTGRRTSLIGRLTDTLNFSKPAEDIIEEEDDDNNNTAVAEENRRKSSSTLMQARRNRRGVSPKLPPEGKSGKRAMSDPGRRQSVFDRMSDALFGPDKDELSLSYYNKEKEELAAISEFQYFFGLLQQLRVNYDAIKSRSLDPLVRYEGRKAALKVVIQGYKMGPSIDNFNGKHSSLLGSSPMFRDQSQKLLGFVERMTILENISRRDLNENMDVLEARIDYQRTLTKELLEFYDQLEKRYHECKSFNFGNRYAQLRVMSKNAIARIPHFENSSMEIPQLLYPIGQ